MAKKKVYDIIPPGKREELIGRSKKVLIKRPTRRVKEKRQRQYPTFSKKKAFLTLALIVSAIVIYWFFSVAKTVRIELFPHIDKLTLNTNIVFSTSSSEFLLSTIDLSETIIPAVPIELEKTFTKEFPSSEVGVEEKAHGTIRVYNKHTRTLSLVEGTRFLSSSEPIRQFHTQEKITIPMGGHVDVSVVASENGEEYNIEPCIFSIPGLRNFAPPQLYYNVFGESFSDMEGGRKDIAHKITQQGLDNAQKQLLEIAREEIKVALKNAAGPNFKILDKSIELEFVKGSAVNAEKGQETSTFTYEIKVRATGLKVQTSFLVEFAKEYVISSLAAHKDFVEEFLTVKFLPEAERVLGGATMVKGEEIKENLEISVDVYSKIDESSLREIVKGRGRSDISRYALEICPELLEPPKIEFKPFWARNVAIEPDKVEIAIMFE
ncbi:MAG: hypothetical protein U9Q96_00805 [Patescibacteria group bacterium]|nr:hypothetical protein [Patescibacteria group bacterium]